MLRPGRHLIFDPLWRTRIQVVSVRDPWLSHPELDVIVRSGALNDEARVLDLEQHQRALVWIDGRFAAVCPAGLTVIWTVFRKVRVEVVDVRSVRFEHPELRFILASETSPAQLEQVVVEAGQRGLVFVDGKLTEELAPGGYAFWRGVGRVKVLHVDLREQVADVGGQDIMTADKVTLRLNAVVTYRVTDPQRAVTASEDFAQALYRQAQLAMREVVGARELDALLADRVVKLI